MKRIGLLSMAFAAMLTLACGGEGRNERENDNAAVGGGDAGTAGARGTAGDAGEGADRNVSNRTQSWVEDRLAGGMAEVKLGELATQKAQNADVKAFGRKMVQDHTKAGEELKQIASQRNIQAPTQLEDDHRDQMDSLTKLQGAEFDREYINLMVDNHEKTLDAVEERVEVKGDDRNPQYTPKTTDDQFDSRINQWAAKTAPTVKQHLEKAKQINEKLGRRSTTNDR